MRLVAPGTGRGIDALRRAGALALLWASCWVTAAGAQELQVIELRHRLAEQVIPALQPLLEPGAALTGMDATLFVRTSPANFEQIRQAVAVLDRAPRQLRITVGQGTVESVTESAVRGSATVGGGDVQVGVNRPPAGESGATVVARNVTQREHLSNIGSVTALEGTETYISTGQTAPLTATRVTPVGSGPGVARTTEYREASTGFYATARVNGDVVTLDLAPRQERFSGPSSDPRIEHASLTTQVSGRLGEWILVGGSGTSQHTDSSGLLTWGTRSGDASYSVWVKVEEMP